MSKNLKSLSKFSCCSISIVLMSLPLSVYANSELSANYRESYASAPTSQQNSNWQVVPHVTGGDVRSIIHVGGAIFVGTSNGVLKSINHSKSWVKSGLQDISITALVESNGVIYAGAKYNYATRSAGIYSSSDSGKTWHIIGLKRHYVYALAVSDNKLYAITIGGVFLYDPNTKIWEKIAENRGYLSLAVSHGILYAGTSKGLFKYIIKEKKWEELGLSHSAINTIKINNGLLYIGTHNGLYRYIIRTKKWQPMGLKNRFINTIHIHNNAIDVGTQTGFFTSNDDGKTWERFNAGLENKEIAAMLFTQNNNIYVATKASGIFKSVNQGKYWQAVNNGLTIAPITSLISYNNDVYVGLNGGGIFIGKNDGQDWSVNNQGLTNLNVSKLIASDNVIYASAYSNFMQTVGVFKSTNAGIQWNLANTGLEDKHVFSFAANKDVIYAGTQYGVFSTMSAGKSWQPLGLENDTASLVAVDKFHNTIYAYVANNPTALYKCKINHCSWTLAGLQGAHLWQLAVDDKGVIYALGTDSDLFYFFNYLYTSNDQGKTWTKALVSGAHGEETKIFTLAHGAVYAATFDGRVIRSKDKGFTWTTLTTKPLPGKVSALLVIGRKIYASTVKNGLYVYQPQTKE